MPFRRVSGLFLVAACVACDQVESGFGNVDTDTASVIAAVLEYRLSIEDSIPLDRRLLPADTIGGVMPPFSLEHATLPPSPLLAEVAGRITGLTLAPLRRTDADSGWVMSVSRPIVLGDSAVVYWITSYFEPASTRYRYWAAFFRVDLVRTGDHWRITRVTNAGSEN